MPTYSKRPPPLLLAAAWLACMGFATGQPSAYPSQRREVDSLRRLSETSLPPAKALHISLELAGHYLDFSQLDSVQLYIDEGVRLNEIVRDSAKGFFLTAYQTEVFLYSTLYEQGIQAAMKGLQQAEQLHDPEMTANQYNLLGLLYAEMAQYQQAVGFFELSLKHLPPASKHVYGLTRRYHLLSNLAQCHEKLGDVPMAVRYNLSSLKEARQDGGFRGMAVASWSLGNIFHAQGHYREALAHYRQSLQHAQAIHDVDAAVMTYPKLFYVHEKLGDARSARNALQQGLALAGRDTRRIKPNSLKEFYTDIIKIYHQLGHYRNVVDYQQKLDGINQQITQQERKQRLAVLAAYYDNEKRMSGLRLEKKEQESQLRQQRLFVRYAGLLAVAAAAAAGAFYYAFRQQQRLRNWKLKQQITALEQRQEMAALRGMLEGEEQERVRIARELHDGLTGLLVAARHQVEAHFRHLPQAPDATQLLDKACREVRRISHNLMPYALQRHGLADALQQYCAGVRQAGLIGMDYQTLGWAGRLPPTLELWLYRIVQELVNNTLKHAGATQALVQLSRLEELIQITVEDNGRGFDPRKAATKDANGLRSIESRVKYLKGSLSVVSDGRGTSTHIELSLHHIPDEL